MPEPLPELRLSPGNYTASHWISTYRRKGEKLFDLDAPYQRGSVWNLDQRRNLIKSLFIGLPVGNIIYSELPYKENGYMYRIVDGKQRIETINAFFSDLFDIPGHWLRPKYLQEEQRRHHFAYCSDLSEQGRRHLENTQMGGFKFDATVEYTENPAYDPEFAKTYNAPRGGFGNIDTRADRYNRRTQTDAEILKAEAELYLLVNFGGVPQTEDDKARATAVTTDSLAEWGNNTIRQLEEQYDELGERMKIAQAEHGLNSLAYTNLHSRQLEVSRQLRKMHA